MDRQPTGEVRGEAMTVFGELEVHLEALQEVYERVDLANDPPTVNPDDSTQAVDLAGSEVTLRDSQVVANSRLAINARYTDNSKAEIFLSIDRRNLFSRNFHTQNFLALRDTGEVIELLEDPDGVGNAEEVSPEESAQLLDDIRSCVVVSINSNA